MTAMVVYYQEVVATHGTDKVTYEDVITLVHYMAENHYDSSTIAYAVEKPWKYVEEIKEAKEVARHESESENV